MAKVRLDNFLQDNGLVGSLKEAQAAILSGNVFLNNIRCDKCGHQTAPDAIVTLKQSKKRYVSRGGTKLQSALDTFNIYIQGRIALDIGVSTGGFSDVLLQRQIAQVIGVDVSYGIVDLKIRKHPKFQIIERQNARHLTESILKKVIQTPHHINLVVMDVSFISVTKILPKLPGIISPDTDYIILIKPQFEAPRDWVGKGGIIKDPDLIHKTLDRVKETCESSQFTFIDSCPSGILGTKGNQEYFFHLKSQ